MATLSFKVDKLFMLLVPELVVWFGVLGAISFPSESDFVQKFYSVWSNLVLLKNAPLPSNPNPQRLVLLISVWHHTMAILSFKLDQLFILHVPFLVMFVHHGSQKALCKRGSK
jgi:hypothetical protein